MKKLILILILFFVVGISQPVLFSFNTDNSSSYAQYQSKHPRHRYQRYNHRFTHRRYNNRRHYNSEGRLIIRF